MVLDYGHGDVYLTEIVYTYDGGRQKVVCRGPTLSQEIKDWKARIADEWKTNGNCDYSYQHARLARPTSSAGVGDGS